VDTSGERLEIWDCISGVFGTDLCVPDVDLPSFLFRWGSRSRRRGLFRKPRSSAILLDPEICRLRIFIRTGGAAQLVSFLFSPSLDRFFLVKDYLPDGPWNNAFSSPSFPLCRVIFLQLRSGLFCFPSGQGGTSFGPTATRRGASVPNSKYPCEISL